MSRQRVKIPSRGVCVGDLTKRIILHNRSIVAPEDGETDFTEDFVAIKTIWAAMKTVTGKTIFDGINTDVNITHEIYIRFRDDVTEETWVEYKGKLIDIKNVENLEESDEFLKLSCTERGLKTSEASHA